MIIILDLQDGHPHHHPHHLASPSTRNMLVLADTRPKSPPSPISPLCRDFTCATYIIIITIIIIIIIIIIITIHHLEQVIVVINVSDIIYIVF